MFDIVLKLILQSLASFFYTLRVELFTQDILHCQFNNSNDLYTDIFISNKKNHNNYVAYTQHTDSKDQVSPYHNCNQTDFLKFIKKPMDELSNKLAEDESHDEKDIKELEKLLLEINLNQFLPIITSTNNGIIPYQLHLAELEQILEKASQHYSFLNDKVIDEIHQIFTFKIPYYVGPLNTNSKQSWIVRNSFESIRPWNFKDIVNIEDTEERFIRNMTNKCTYLFGEDVLPKNSLLYSEYEVRNSLNILTIDGVRLDNSTLEYLYEDLFVQRTTSGKISKKRIISSLKKIGTIVSESSIGGINEEIPAKLKSLHDYNRIFPNKEISHKDFEEIIERSTIFSEGGGSLKRWLNTVWGDTISESQISNICRLNYSGWGRFSKKFLIGLKHTQSNQQKLSILEYMSENPLNLMEILHDENLSYGLEIDKHNDEFKKNDFEITEDDLDNLYISPSVKKAIRQTIHVINELFSIMSGAPERIFVEMARENAEKKATKSRKKIVDELYKGIKNFINEFDAEVKDKGNSASIVWNKKHDTIDDNSLKSKRMYLYYRQWGRCMYSGNAIDLNKLFDINYYDIDHIYPRSLTKDDSFDNIVLVRSELNRDKSDSYPISGDVRKKMVSFWQALYRGNFISQEKLKRLTGNSELSDDQLKVFINRQLVETRQSTKAISKILRDLAINSDVVYVKSNHVSDFRYQDGMRSNAYTKFYFPKVRDINDFHHAKDAYLNIIVGNVYFSKFTKNFFLKNNKNFQSKYNLVKLYDRDIKDGDYLVWKAGMDGTIKIVNQMMKRNNILLSVEAHKQRGQFFDIQIVKKGSGQFPIKTSVESLTDINKYGGFNKVSGSHFCLIEHSKKGKQILTFETVPIIFSDLTHEPDLVTYFESLGYTKPKIIRNNILYKSIVYLNGTPYRILGKSGTSIKCGVPVQAKYYSEDEEYLKYLERILSKEKEPKVFNTNELEKFFRGIVSRLKEKPFNNYYSKTAEKLIELSDSFHKMAILDQIKLVFSIINLLNSRGLSADLSELHYQSTGRRALSQAGGTSINVNQKPTTKIQLKGISITGFFENIVEINE